MDIQDMRIIARVAAVQNLSAVGSELGLTPGTISKRIQALEDELSVRLFDRTTRSIRITEEGATFLVHVERILAELEAARATVADKIGKPIGKLKIAAPNCLGRRHIVLAVSEFMHRYPAIDVEIDLTDGPVNLQEAGYDIAIRTGSLTNSSLIAKRLAPDRRIIVAAPDYLDVHGCPFKPQDLAEHSCLSSGETWQWSLAKGSEEITVRINGRLKSNDGEVLCQAAIAGHGLILASEIEVLPELRSGELVRVLTEYDVTPDAAIWALYPSAKHVLPRLRAMLDFLGDWFRQVQDPATPPRETMTVNINAARVRRERELRAVQG
jgi:DNA-binding transcriptional LysR family regulator